MSWRVNFPADSKGVNEFLSIVASESGPHLSGNGFLSFCLPIERKSLCSLKKSITLFFKKVIFWWPLKVDHGHHLINRPRFFFNMQASAPQDRMAHSFVCGSLASTSARFLLLFFLMASISFPSLRFTLRLSGWAAMFVSSSSRTIRQRKRLFSSVCYCFTLEAPDPSSLCRPTLSNSDFVLDATGAWLHLAVHVTLILSVQKISKGPSV